LLLSQADFHALGGGSIPSVTNSSPSSWWTVLRLWEDILVPNEKDSRKRNQNFASKSNIKNELYEKDIASKREEYSTNFLQYKVSHNPTIEDKRA
jgi:hypothetical protein